MDPREVWLGKHFLLSDFLGCHSVYAEGLSNGIAHDDPELPLKMANGRALAGLLDSIVETFGPLTISYGIIAPHVSRRIVKYQDGNKPSYHLWNLGAAADICVHRWVNEDPDRNDQQNSPFNLALFGIHDRLALPYSRIISYSESPYLCIAARASELEEGAPRRALYENRYEGVPRQTPAYLKYAGEKSKKDETLDRLFQDPLTHGWRGQGYPSSHLSGQRQFQHIRVSKYTMLIDWLFDWKLISTGVKNIPPRSDEWMEMFFACGDVYDAMIEELDVPRLPIVQGFVAPGNLRNSRGVEWTDNRASFALAVPPHIDFRKADRARQAVSTGIGFSDEERRRLTFSVEV